MVVSPNHLPARSTDPATSWLAAEVDPEGRRRIRTALTELERDGLAHPTDSYGRTERGRRARKWEATRR